MLADKIIELRKSQGWSQETFAEKMNVSRQAVSKWELAQSIPDLDKILTMSGLFGVSTDYLLKDDMHEVEYAGEDAATYIDRRVSLKEATEYLELLLKKRWGLAFGTFLCIISPILLIGLIGAVEHATIQMSEALAVSIGLTSLIVLVAIAVVCFIHYGMLDRDYRFLDHEPFELEYGVKQVVQQKQQAFRSVYMKHNIIGTLCCILSVVPLFIAASFDQDVMVLNAVCVLLLIVACGVFSFVSVGVVWGGYERLLQEGNFKVSVKTSSPLMETIAGAYWMLVTAIYLLMSFTQNNWGQSWIIWPVSGVLFAMIAILVEGISNHKKQG